MRVELLYNYNIRMAFVAEKSLPFTQSRIQGFSRKGLLFKKKFMKLRKICLVYDCINMILIYITFIFHFMTPLENIYIYLLQKIAM